MAVNPRFDLNGRTVIVTGGGKGIGKVYAQEFAKAGAKVVACDIDEAAAKWVAGALTAEGLEALGVGTDISSEQRPKRWPRSRLIASVRSTCWSTTPR